MYKLLGFDIQTDTFNEGVFDKSYVWARKSRKFTLQQGHLNTVKLGFKELFGHHKKVP